MAATEPAADPRPLGAADTAFGLDVLRAWCAQYPGKNLVFSPSTLASALGMAYLGAHGATAAAMAAVLHLPGGRRHDALAAGLQARADALGGTRRARRHAQRERRGVGGPVAAAADRATSTRWRPGTVRAWPRRRS